MEAAEPAAKKLAEKEAADALKIADAAEAEDARVRFRRRDARDDS